MMQLSSRPFISEAITHMEAKQRRTRLWSSPAAKQEVKAVAAPVVVKARLERPMWRQAETMFDQHVSDYRRHLFNQARKIDAYIEKRAVELGFTYDEMVGHRRFRPLTHARQLIWWEIKSFVKPDASWKELGRAMGNKDHSSPFVAFHKFEALKAQEAR